MTNDRRSTFCCMRLAAVALALGIFSSAGIAPVGAQDASPVASPETSCVSPGAVDTATAVAGTPVASDTATGTEADEATAATIFATIENYAACFNEGQATGNAALYVALESSNYLASLGYSSAEERVADESSSPAMQASLLSLDNAMVWDDGRVSADAELVLGDHWYQHLRIFLTDANGAWLYDQETPLPPTPDVDFVAVNGLSLTEVEDEETGESGPAIVSLGGTTDFTETEGIIFNVTNALPEAYGLAVVALPEGADPTGLLDGSLSFDEVTFLGATNDVIATDGAADLTLLGLPVGSYAFLAFPDGESESAPLTAAFNIVAAG
ncbi:MAG: hypothetical protein M9947_09470 [Thermomicrobiales bacterium]|nr:hypothetical protein [Thermomicrobiales bacterium]